MNDLESISRFLHRRSYRLSRKEGASPCIEELLDAALMTRYDIQTHECGMMTNKIPSTIYISFDPKSLTADNVSCSETNLKKAVWIYDGFLTAL